MFKYVFVLFALLLNACGGINSYLGNVGVMLERCTIVGEPNMNGNSATPLDLVIVYDINLLAQIAQLTAADYFIKKAQIMKDNPNLIEAISFEIVPTQVIPDQAIKLSRPNAEGAILFANYATPGEHRLKVGRQTELLIKLTETEMIITPEN